VCIPDLRILLSEMEGFIHRDKGNGEDAYLKPELNNEPRWLTKDEVGTFLSCFIEDVTVSNMVNKRWPKRLADGKRRGRVGGKSAQYHPITIVTILMGWKSVSDKSIEAAFLKCSKISDVFEQWNNEWKKLQKLPE
jgi:hypothetical protein